MGAPAVGLKSVLIRSKSLVHSEVDGEVTMMNIETGKYYGLTSNVAADIWRYLEEPVQADRICERLITSYRVDPLRCETEVIRFLQKLVDEGVVTTSIPRDD